MNKLRGHVGIYLPIEYYKGITKMGQISVWNIYIYMYFHLIFYKYFQGLILVILIISIEQITWVRKCFFFYHYYYQNCIKRK